MAPVPACRASQTKVLLLLLPPSLLPQAGSVRGQAARRPGFLTRGGHDRRSSLCNALPPPCCSIHCNQRRDTCTACASQHRQDSRPSPSGEHLAARQRRTQLRQQRRRVLASGLALACRQWILPPQVQSGQAGEAAENLDVAHATGGSRKERAWDTRASVHGQPAMQQHACTRHAARPSLALLLTRGCGCSLMKGPGCAAPWGPAPGAPAPPVRSRGC